MRTPPTPENEPSRLKALRALNILDTAPEERFDRLTRLAKRLFGVPIALVSLVDDKRQWFKSAQGLDVKETPREISFCGHAILGDEMFLVADAELDHRFADNPLVTGSPNIRFYAGVPLSVPNGSKLGTLCLLDREPRVLSQEDRELLEDLAKMAQQEMAAVQMATMDELTLLSNRRGFIALGQHCLNVCRRRSATAALLFFDLTRFKQVNDQYGHAEGDRALAAFADLLREVFRDSDVIGRLGGDEFVVMLSSADQRAEEALQRLRNAVAAYNEKTRRGYTLEFNVGVAHFDAQKHQSVDDLIHEADTLMYAQKKRMSAG